jgi:hypothetical protein
MSPQGFKDLPFYLLTAPVMAMGNGFMTIGCLRGANGYLTMESLENGFSNSDLWKDAKGKVSNLAKNSIWWAGNKS